MEFMPLIHMTRSETEDPYDRAVACIPLESTSATPRGRGKTKENARFFDLGLVLPDGQGGRIGRSLPAKVNPGQGSFLDPSSSLFPFQRSLAFFSH